MSLPQNLPTTDGELSARAPNFDRLARLYRWMEVASFGPWLWWCRCAFLAETASCGRALILGDGDGRFTARLLRGNSAVQVDAVDASAAMLAALIRRAGSHVGRVRTYLCDARRWQPTSATNNSQLPYDLIATHFFLDCLTTTEVQMLAVRLRSAVSPDAVWVVSEFAIPNGWYGRLLARPLVWGLYRAFGWLTELAVRSLPDHRSALRVAGFTRQKSRQWLGGLLVSELWRVDPSDSAVNPTGNSL